MKYVCRICLQEVNDLNFVALKTNEQSHIWMQLSICCPETKADLVKDPVFCQSCLNALHSAYNFKNQCLQTEECILSYSRKILSNTSIDIKDLLYDLQDSARPDVCKDNCEVKNTKKEGFAVTPNTNLLLSDEDLANGQNLNTDSNTDQHSVRFPIATANKIKNANNAFSKPAIQTTADDLNNLLDYSLPITPIQPRVFKQEGENENEDIVVKEEDIALPKMESSLSYAGFEGCFFQDAGSKDHIAELKGLDNKSAILQKNIATQNCFVKLTRFPEGIVHKRNRFICKICKFTTVTKYYLKKHEAIHDKTKRFSCGTCTFHTVQKLLLIKHMRTHTGEKPFSCNVCSYRSAHQSHLERHLRIHTGEKPFSCNVCMYRSAQQSHLQEHLRMHTGEKPFACNFCTFRSATSATLKRHIQTHTGERPFVCNMCNYCCSRNSVLKQHLRMHSGEKPFACNFCTFRFATSAKLKRHILTHTGEKPFVCSVCTFSSVDKSNLVRHLQIHTGEKPFICNVCNFRSARRSGLVKHLRIHTGEKPFACNVCAYRAAEKSQLQRHLQIHTDENQNTADTKRS